VAVTSPFHEQLFGMREKPFESDGSQQPTLIHIKTKGLG
jgi:hypothetical protein